MTATNVNNNNNNNDSNSKNINNNDDFGLVREAREIRKNESVTHR